MAILTMPTKSLGAYEYEILLENQILRFSFSYNKKYDYWTLDIQNRAAEDLVRGLKLVLNYEIMKRLRIPTLPRGALLPTDTTEKLLNIGELAFENGAQLLYVTEDLLNELV